MEMHERITRIVNQPGRGILAADVRGGLHRFDTDLNLVASSATSATAQDPAGSPVYAVAVVGDRIITRDKVGNISRWDAESLRLIDRLDARATANKALLLEGEQPSPTILRGIGVWDGKIYVDNGYFQVVVIDAETFAVERIVMWPHGYNLLEWFCTDAPGVHAVSDREGRIYFGRLDGLSFPTMVRVDRSNVHRVMYDKRHNRFWATLDAGIDDSFNVANGVVTVGLDGTVGEKVLFARNDVEGLVFSPDFTRAYTGGFDGELLIFDNTTPKLTIAKRVGGFSHQIIDITVDEQGRVYVLTQDGEIVACTPDGEVIHRLGFGRQCVWDLQPVPGDDTALLAATDSGTALVRLVERSTDHPALVCERTHDSGIGFTRRVVTHEDGWTGVYWPRTVRRTDGAGKTVWEKEMPGIAHTVAVSPDGARVLVACNAGGVELDAATGEQVDLIDGLPASAWASAYLPDGQRVLATRNGLLAAWDAAGTVTWSMELGSYPKRLLPQDDRVRVAGGGGIKELLVGDDKPSRTFSELLDNTVENAVVIDGTLVAVTYGMQVAAYDHETEEILAIREDLPDFAKGVAALRGRDGAAYVVVGGRGGYLRLYRVDRGDGRNVLMPLRDLWLQPAADGYPSVAEAATVTP